MNIGRQSYLDRSPTLIHLNALRFVTNVWILRGYDLALSWLHRIGGGKSS
jgi:hypothetical protein